MKYTPPQFAKNAFSCPHCGIYAVFSWQPCYEKIQTAHNIEYKLLSYSTATCDHCHGRTLWVELGKNKGQMLWPVGVTSAPTAHELMPEDVRTAYAEARNVVSVSPSAAAALLRLAIQRLCVHLGESGEDINDDIASLIKKGLPTQIQRALDIARVTGKNAVRPGELRIEDIPDVAVVLFDLVNLIVENQIAQQARIQELYKALGKDEKNGVEGPDR